MKKSSGSSLFLLLAAFLAMPAFCRADAKASAELLAPLMEKLDNGDVRLGAVTVHPETKTLSFPATVNMADGMLEVLVATPRGRLHESLFRAEVLPLHLQTMLYLLGLDNGPRLAAPGLVQGSLVDIDVEWIVDGVQKRLAVEELLWEADRKTKKPRQGWSFVGSRLRDGIFLAEEEGNLVLLWSVGSTILDTSDPRTEEDELFYVNKDEVPPEGTAVRIIITPRKKIAE